MKKLITTISIIAISIGTFATLSLSVNAIAETCKTTTECEQGEVCNNGLCEETINALLPRPGEIDPENSELAAVGDLPDVSIPNLIATAIKTILGWSMIITLAAIVVSAIFYLMSQGNEESTSKAKNIIIYLVIGIAIMAAAYGVVSGVTQFKFFQAVQ